MRIRTSVVFPAPEGPSIAVTLDDKHDPDTLFSKVYCAASLLPWIVYVRRLNVISTGTGRSMEKASDGPSCGYMGHN